MIVNLYCLCLIVPQISPLALLMKIHEIHLNEVSNKLNIEEGGLLKN